MSTFAEHQPADVSVMEDERVSLWRLEQFLTLGFDDEHACQLAESDADLNRARSLAAAGCPGRVAIQILI
jgi:hypothetical protein